MHLRNLKSVASSQKRSRNPDHAPFGDIFFTLGGTCRIVDPLAKFKQRSLTHSRNIEGGLKFRKRIRYPDHAPFGGGVSPSQWDLSQLIHLPNLMSV